MSNVDIIVLSWRRNIKAQLKIVNATEGKTFSIAEMKPQLKLLHRIEDKFKVIRKEYYKLIEEDKIEETEEQLSYWIRLYKN